MKTSMLLIAFFVLFSCKQKTSDSGFTIKSESYNPVGFSESNNAFKFTDGEVIVTPVQVESEVLRGKPGMLVVKKGMLVDTIFDCHYGLTPDYKFVKINNKDFLYVQCVKNGMGNNFFSVGLWNLDSRSFLQPLFVNEFQTSKESSYISLDPPIKEWTDSSYEFKFVKDGVNITVDSLKGLYNWDTVEIIDTISFGRKIYFHSYNKFVYSK